MLVRTPALHAVAERQIGGLYVWDIVKYMYVCATANLASLAEAVSSQDHVEGVLARHRRAQLEVAVSSLLQQQRALQIRFLKTE